MSVTLERNRILIDTVEVETVKTHVPEVNIDKTITNEPYFQESLERMYPPVRNITSPSYTISGQSYGNGIYKTEGSASYRGSTTEFAPFSVFNNTGIYANGPGFAENKYTNGVYNSTDYIVSGYKGDYLIVELPVEIKLTKYGFRQRTLVPTWSPGFYKIYGSNDKNNWDVLVDNNTTKPTYTNNEFLTSVNITQSYKYFGLVVNQLLGSATLLNFDEWYIYGKESVPPQIPADSTIHKYLTFQYSPYAKLEADYNNLKLHYKFDEDGSGSGLKDETNNYPLTNSGTNVTFTSTEKVVGTSSYFPATGTNHLSITNNFNPYSLWNGNGITISWWAKLSSSQLYGRIFEFGSDSNNRITNYAYDGDMSITIRKNGSNDYFNIFVNNNGVGVWKHYVMSVSSSGVWSSYLNGVNQNISYTFNIPDIPYPYSRLGEAIYGASYDQLQGYIDDFRVYNKVLSSTEVSKLYNDTNKTETTYTLNVPEDTTCDVLVINNTQSYKATGETLNGTYNVIVGSNSKIEKDGTDLYVPNSELSITDNITGESISYGLNNPIVIIRYSTKYIRQHPAYDAQWTYHSTNPNVHHYGNVGIGALASETNKLTVKGDMNMIGNYKQNDVNLGHWYSSDNSNNIHRLAGNVGIGTTDPQYSVDTTGVVYASHGGFAASGTSTNWATSSDERIKDNITLASNETCFENVKNINLYKFNYKDKYSKHKQGTQYGFIAQEVQKYYPKAVKYEKIKVKDDTYESFLTINQTQLNYTLFGAVKHLQQELDTIKVKLGMVEPIQEEPVAETNTTEEPVAETNTTEEPATEETNTTEEPVAEETNTTEEPATEETNTTEEPVAEETNTNN